MKKRKGDEMKGVSGFVEGVFDVLLLLIVTSILIRLYEIIPVFWNRTIGVSATDFVIAISLAIFAIIILIYAIYGIYSIVRFHNSSQGRAFLSVIIFLFVFFASFRLEVSVDPAAFVADKVSGYYFPSFRDCASRIVLEDAKFYVKEDAVQRAGYKRGSCYCRSISKGTQIETQCGDYYELTGEERPS